MAATSHEAGLRKRQMVAFTAHFLSLGLSWGAGLGMLERRRQTMAGKEGDRKGPRSLEGLLVR